MKLAFKTAALLLIQQAITFQSYSQTEVAGDYEAYSKANIAFTDFKLLGVTTNEFAKCVKSVNYLHPEKRHKIVMLDGVLFVDDGKNYDLVADDGVLTSVATFGYPKGSETVPVGGYRLSENSATLYDANFIHRNKVDIPSRSTGIGIECTFVWVPCSSWPPAIQQVCLDLSWPLKGGIHIKECKVGITFN